MTTWRELQAILDETAERGDAIRVWWRDDDAGHDHPMLSRLLALAERHDLPIAVAVVPTWLDDGAQARLAASSQATVLQHGFAHANHAPAGAKSTELGGREVALVAAELGAGHTLLKDAFGAAFLAVLAPPWNRLDPDVVAHLAACGFRGLSTFGPRPAAEIAPGVAQVNTHLDPIAWRTDRLFVGEAAALTQLRTALDLDEPIGILSHHLAMDEAGWAFLERLLATLRAHPAAQLCGAAAVFGDAA